MFHINNEILYNSICGVFYYKTKVPIKNVTVHIKEMVIFHRKTFNRRIVFTVEWDDRIFLSRLR